MADSDMYDLLIITDATGSMYDYLRALRKSLPEIISLSALTDCFGRIGLLAYRDYCAGEDLLEWSGWLDQSDSATSPKVDLGATARQLRSIGNQDCPEAAKTALAKAYELMRPEATTLILLYTDDIPHMRVTSQPGDFKSRSPHLGRYSEPNPLAEKNALSRPDSYGGYGPAFVDWVSACRTLAMHNGNKKAQVMCFLPSHMEDGGYYRFLSATTGGACFSLARSSVSETTMEVLLAWMGIEKPGVASVELPATWARYAQTESLAKIRDEFDARDNEYFSTHSSRISTRQSLDQNLLQVRLSTKILKSDLPKRKSPLQDFAARYQRDELYRSKATEHLNNIITENVSAMSLNPVFGSLWRAFCVDRSNPAREGVLANFSRQLEPIGDAAERSRMKSWLEESYDRSAEVLDIISSVPEAERFPCIYLDPTLSFAHEPSGRDGDGAADDDDRRPITEFRRDELLEIGRSCDYRILRRLGKVLTRLTYVDTAEAMSAHIAATDDREVPKIPMVLSTEKYRYDFWRILFHTILPGTLLSGRAGALVAALSIRLGIQPLQKAAENEMRRHKSKWNDLKVPENWSIGCLSLLLDADQLHESATAELSPLSDSPPLSVSTGLLDANDRKLFQLLVDYKLLEMNLDSTLVAKVGWTPAKTPLPLGPFAVCHVCNFPRSVTVMGDGGRCGNCIFTAYASEEHRQKCIHARVSSADDETSESIWVECSVQTCRAQYVVYNPEGLQCRPKCHYCRLRGSLPASEHERCRAPVVECTHCLSRVIWPLEYRPAQLSDFLCVACSSGRTTIDEVETTAAHLCGENGTGWLVRNDDNKIEALFDKRSPYHTISRAGTDAFSEKVEVFPSGGAPDLHMRGKLVREAEAVSTQLRSWVRQRRTEAGTCSLCFGSIRKSDLLRACGRSGCAQHVCKACLGGWYGLNAPGRVINTAALHCPFCRRCPTAKTLARYGMRIHALSDLARVVEEQGAWIYAWCGHCARARRYAERVCAAGATPALEGWTCEACTEIQATTVELVIRDCPGCGTATERTSGCNHLECPVEGCGLHWCFACGLAFKFEEDVYGHMLEAHGGYYS